MPICYCTIICEKMNKTNSFKKRVISHLLRQKWNVEHTPIRFIDFFAVHRSLRVRKAYRVQAHGHLAKKEQQELFQYSRQTGTHIIYVHEVAGRELQFVHLYPE